MLAKGAPDSEKVVKTRRFLGLISLVTEAAEKRFLRPDFVFTQSMQNKCTLCFSNYFGCNCKEDISASSPLGILFERTPCKSLNAFRPPRCRNKMGADLFR